MRPSNQNRCSRYLLLCLTLGCLLVQTGCASVDHLRLYRDARKDFSAAAQADNIQTLKNIFPDPKTVKESVNRSIEFKYFDGARLSYEQWYEVHAAFSALNARAERELEQDQLLGSSKAMEIISKSRKDLFAQILSAGNNPMPYPPTASPQPQPSTPDPLTAAVEQADKLLKTKDNQLFSRDEYLLRSLRPTVRYEIAYVNKLRSVRPSDKKNQIEVYAPIIGQMTKAEEELAEVSRSCPANVKNYTTMSRFIMLVAARDIAMNIEGKTKTALTLTNIDYANNEDLRFLNKRINNFRVGTVAAEPTPENELMRNLGLQPTLPELTQWGLDELFDPVLRP
jgi:hypothetical protein